MDNDVFIPLKVRASQIVGVAKIATKFIEVNGLKFTEKNAALESYPYPGINKLYWYNIAQAKAKSFIQSLYVGNIHYLEATAVGNWGNTVLSLEASDVEPEGVFGGNNIGFAVADRITKVLNFRTMFDAEQKSAFVQLPWTRYKSEGALIELNFGSVVIAPATSKVIETQIPREAKGISVTPAFNTEVPYSVEANNIGSFTLRNRHASFGAAFFWIAVG